MKLVIATPLYPPEIGGPATYAKALEAGLPARGVEVVLVKFGEVRHLPRLVRHYAYYRRVLAAVRDADAVLALDPVSTGLPALRAARRLGKPFVVKIVGDYAWEQGRQRFGVKETLDEFVHTRQPSPAVRFLQSLEMRVALGADCIIVPSEYLRRIVLAWGVSSAKIRVIYNAVPMEAKGSVPSEVAKLPRPLVVSAGRLVPWKHFDGVIDAVARTNASLAIIGDGPLRTPLVEQMRSKLAGRSALAGPLSHADTLATVASADIFVLNSSYEGLAHHLIEALALGVPIIATNVGGNPEVVDEGCGVLVPALDPLALEKALRDLLDNQPLRAKLAAGARVAANRFADSAMLEATAALLANLA